MQHFYEIDYGAFGGKLDVLMEEGAEGVPDKVTSTVLCAVC